MLGYFLCNKRTKQGNYYLYSYSAEAENVPLFRIKYAHNDIFVGDSQADQLLRSEWNIPGEAGQKFKNICSLLKEDDNPVLFFYKFKKN